MLEPRDGWSLTHLRADAGEAALVAWRGSHPNLESHFYEQGELDLDRVLDGADLVLVHEWTEPSLVRQLGGHRRGGGDYRLLFHDTHHRSVSDPDAMASYDLACFDGVLVFGEAIREIYLRRGWARQVWTWHEAADTDIFRPLPGVRQRDLIWIGNWGDGERTRELQEFCCSR